MSGTCDTCGYVYHSGEKLCPRCTERYNLLEILKLSICDECGVAYCANGCPVCNGIHIRMTKKE